MHVNVCIVSARFALADRPFVVTPREHVRNPFMKILSRGARALGSVFPIDPFHGVSLVVLLAASFATRASAQCGVYTSEFANSNAPDITVMAATGWDDGAGGEALVVGGVFDHVGTLTTANVARWDSATGWSSIGGANQAVRALGVFQLPGDARPLVYAGGDFTTIGSVASHRVARFDGTSWSALGSGLPANFGECRALAAFDDGAGVKLYVAGSAPWPVANVWSFDGTNWAPVGDLQLVQTVAPTTVYTLAVHDDGTGPRLYAGGTLPNLGCVARWDGVAWTNIAVPGLGGFTVALASFDAGTGRELYAANSVLGPMPVARWNGSSWTNVGQSFTGPGSQAGFSALAVVDGGNGPELYLGGTFSTSVPGTTQIAKLAANQWISVGGGLQDTPATTRRVLAITGHLDVHTGERALILGGRFTGSASGVPATTLARFAFCSRETFCAGDGAAPGVAPCPCGNTGAIGHGCENSALLGGGLLAVRGVTSVSNDSVELAASSLTNGLVVFLQAAAPSNGGFGVTFENGVSCLATPLVRLGSRQPIGHESELGAGHAGDPAISVAGALPAGGGTRWYQARYRSRPAACTTATANWTNGVVVHWVP